MKTLSKILILLTGAAFTSGAHAKLNVVATTPDFAAIAQQIGGDQIELSTLAKPTEDPHFVDAKPSFIVKLNRADVLIEGGAELEIGWLPALMQSSRNPKIAAGAPGHIACAEGVQLLEVPTALDRSQGDVHAAGNPHFTTDPVNVKVIAGHICNAFSQLDPKSAEVYRANLKQFEDRLEAKLTAWKAILAPFGGRRIVAYHNMWPYFGRRFGLNIDLFLEPKPGIPPSPAHLADVIGEMKAQNIRVILSEPYVNRKTAETVARNTGANVLDVAQFPGGVKGTEGGYIELMDYLVNSLAKTLGGTAVAKEKP
ncbi:MAG: metal ABC transporter substrate-binding protein [Opitutaceae bacterium]